MKCGAEFLGDTAGGDYGVQGTIVPGVAEATVGKEQQRAAIQGAVVKYIVSPRGEIKSASLVSGEPPLLFFGGVYLTLGPHDPVLMGGWAYSRTSP